MKSLSRFVVYTSKTNFAKAEAVEARLFEHLHTLYQFRAVEDDSNSCIIEFTIDFEFKSYMYAYIANIFFMEVASKMVQAFEERCRTLYGDSSVKDMAMDQL